MNLPDNPFLQLTAPRVAHALQVLKASFWEDPQPVAVSYSRARPAHTPFAEARRLDYAPVTLPFCWGRLFETGWFHLRFPAEMPGRTRTLQWIDQGEGTLFLDETPYYGFDVAHRFVELPAGVQEGWIEGLCLQSAIWHPEAGGTTPQGSQLSTARIVHRNDAAWKAYHMLEVYYDLAKAEARPSPDFAGLVQEGSGYRRAPELVSVTLRRLLRVMDEAVSALDAGGPAAMLASFEAAAPLLHQSPMPIRSVLTGHAHIDLVWLWPERCAEYKARHTFASVNRLMAQYPEFRFAYSQSASYEAVQRDCPAILDAVRERLKSGQWEAVGATYVEMDNLMACGEALARAFLVGQEVFHELFGASSKTLWLPDVFGYAGCLPQIMRQCGVENFFTTKLTWSNINRFPYSSFLWRGVDGSEVLTHVTQELGYNQNALPSEACTAARAYLQSDVHDACLQPTGFGDGGGGPTPEMCERARIQARLSGCPQVQWGRIDDFFDDLNQVRAKLPAYQGELFLEYHRGTFTTHGDLKAAFRGLERALQVQEAVCALLGAGPVDAHAWKRLIFSQFHDYIPGSSIREVYVEGLPELNGLAAQALAGAAARLGEGPLVMNPLPLARPATRLKQGQLERILLPPLAAVDAESLPGTPVAAPSAGPLSLQSDRVSVRLTPEGEISALSVDGVPVAIAGSLNQLWIYPDHPHKYPAWDIDRQTLSLGRRLDSPVEVLPAQTGPGTASLGFRRRVGQASQLTVTYTLDARHAEVEVELDLDWQEQDALLQAHFPTHYQGRFARFGAPFNSVLRGQQPGAPKDEAMFEACASRWAAVQDDSQSEGLHLITEAKYGMGCRDGDLHVSLVRSVRVTGEDIHHQRIFPEANRDLSPRDPYSDRGRHCIRYALGRFHAALPREAQPGALADLLYTPTLPAAQAASAGLLALSGGDSLLPTWAKPLPQGAWLLRLHESLGRAGTVTVSLAPGWTLARTQLSEADPQPCGLAVAFRPYEIVSLILQPPA